jgi:hypothetical protein
LQIFGGKEEIPDNWKEGSIVKLSKKGDTSIVIIGEE